MTTIFHINDSQPDYINSKWVITNNAKKILNRNNYDVNTFLSDIKWQLEKNHKEATLVRIELVPDSPLSDNWLSVMDRKGKIYLFATEETIDILTP